MTGPGDKAAVLIEALPYFRTFRKATFVVKLGGRCLEDETLLQGICQDLSLLYSVGIHIVIVHGGGSQVSEHMAKLGLSPTFIEGLRVTDDSAMGVVEMVLCGQLNKQLVRSLSSEGAPSIGLSGQDGGIAEAKLDADNPQLGRIGIIESINPKAILGMLGEYIPVVAPVCATITGESLNVNADVFAAALSAALGAEKLILVTDTEGVLDDEKQLIPSLSRGQAEALIESGVIAGGMIPKVRNALGAVRGGVGKVHIVNGQTPHALLLEIFTSVGIGTELVEGSSNE